MRTTLLTMVTSGLLLVGCGSPRDLPPQQQPARFIDETEKNRRAREVDALVRENITSTGIRTLGYLPIRGHDFTPQVKEFASRIGAAFVGPLDKADFPPDFFVAYDVKIEQRISRDHRHVSLSANLVRTVAQEQGQGIVAISKQAGRCILKEDSIVLFSCDELPSLMAEAALYSFVHP